MIKKASLASLFILLAWAFAPGTATAEPWNLVSLTECPFPERLAGKEGTDPAPALELDIFSRAAERSSRCTVRCQSDPTIKCSSNVGDCQYYAGGLVDWISCDGIQYECPFPEPPQ